MEAAVEVEVEAEEPAACGHAQRCGRNANNLQEVTTRNCFFHKKSPFFLASCVGYVFGQRLRVPPAPCHKNVFVAFFGNILARLVRKVNVFNFFVCFGYIFVI